MKMTNAQIINSINILGNFLDKKFPQKISYAIVKDASILEKEYECYTKSLQKIFKDYDEHILKDEEGNPKKDANGLPLADDSVKEEITEEISSLLKIETEIEFYPINEDILDYEDIDGRYSPLSPRDLLALKNVLCQGSQVEDGEQ